jgi:hypothetical protein
MIRILLPLLFAGLVALPYGRTQGVGGLLDKAKKAVSGEGALSPEEAGAGLKEALHLGVEEAVAFLAEENGYYESIYKILLPEEAQQVTDRLRVVPGFSDVEQELILRLNRAAERAARKATPLFAEAIKQMTLRDALDILLGEPDAATQYLHRSTYDALYGAFRPVVVQSLDEVHARTYWARTVKAYNQLPLLRDVNPELDAYVTEKALEGLFGLIEKKEGQIREDVGARTSPLLQKVFAEQD